MMTREQYANELAEKVGAQAQLINKNGNMVWAIALTKYFDSGFMPVIYIDDFYSHMTVDETVAHIHELEEHDAFHKPFDAEVIKSLLGDYKRLRPMLYIRIMNEKALDSRYVGMSAEQFGFEDLVLVPFIDLNEHYTVPVPAGLCGVPVSILVRDAIENSDFETFELDDGSHIITSKRCGAGAIVKAQEWLAENYPDGYLAIPASTDQFLITKRCKEHPEIDDLMSAFVSEINKRYVNPSDILSDKAYFF